MSSGGRCTCAAINVLHPMGWDAFGQPAEQDAIKRNVNPRTVVPILADTYREQLSGLGIGYDWSREINSTDPLYYRWNQWAFLLLLERGLAYRKNAPVNWCPEDNTVLSNEEVVDGRCWRCGAVVVKKDMEQWFFKITEYGEKLVEGLDRIGWPEGVKTQQRDWIGRSEGVEFDLRIDGKEDSTVRVFTTRVDTVFGMSFVVLSPEHPLVATVVTDEQRADVDAYIARAASLTDVDRTAEGRERTGVFTGAHAVNPVSGHRVPVWVADYVLAGYGTGAIMAVPAHDERDFDFARRYDLPTPVVIVREGEEPQRDEELSAAFIEKDKGFTVNSGEFSGLPCKMAARRIAEWMEGEGIGVRRVNFRLRDWLVSRQRYWGTPIPIIHCPSCGIVPVPLDQLPVVLPDVENYKPGPDGRSPLVRHSHFRPCQMPGLRRRCRARDRHDGRVSRFVVVLSALHVAARQQGGVGPGGCRLLDAGRSLYRRARTRGRASALRALFHQGLPRRRTDHRRRAFPEPEQSGDADRADADRRRFPRAASDQARIPARLRRVVDRPLEQHRQVHRWTR